MALHTELDITKAAKDLFKIVSLCLVNMRKDMKQLFGRRLLDDCLAILNLIAVANAARGAAKIPHFDKLLEHQRSVGNLLERCMDMGFIDLGLYARTLDPVAMVGRQANGLRSKFLPPPVA